MSHAPYTNEELARLSEDALPGRGEYCPRCRCFIPAFTALDPVQESRLRGGSFIDARRELREITGCSAVFAKIWMLHRDGPDPAPLRPPCPYCGQPLFSEKTRQCLHCGWDWHDAQRPVQHATKPRRGIESSPPRTPALPEKFRIKPGTDPLTHEDFKEWPAWSEHYDYEELDTIASWGVDRAWAEREFARMDTGGAHAHYTILDLERLPQHMRIFLRARFRHPAGRVFEGCVMNPDAFCIGIFFEGEEYVFTSHPDMGDLMRPFQKKAEAVLGVRPLFPLTYQTAFRDQEGKHIAGTFSPEWKTA